MQLRIIPVTRYSDCIPIPITVYMVQKHVGGFIFGKWVNIKGYSDKRKAEELVKILK